MNDHDKNLLRSMFSAAVSAADPGRAMAPFLPDPPKGRTIVIGAGKGTAQMAAAFEHLWPTPAEGVVITRYGFGANCQHIKVLEAAHPVPDDAGIGASQALFDAVSDLTADDLVITLISGGGSALLAAPAPGLTLDDEVALNQVLLSSGAPIGAMNSIRKMFSQIKGGRLALAAYPARVVSLIVSDVPGDAPHEVASGPTVPGPGGRDAALAAVRDYAIPLPDHLLTYLKTAPDPPAPEDTAFENNTVHVIASAAKSLDAAAKIAAQAAVNTAILSDAIEGESREIAKMHAAIARETATRNRPFSKPVALLSGGETTVTLRTTPGKGGRNSEFLLSLALEIEGLAGIAALAADTDGIDGSETNAGAFADGQTAAAMRAAGIDPADALARHDAYTAFAAIDALFEPGPTGTNVNDLRVILIR